MSLLLHLHYIFLVIKIYILNQKENLVYSPLSIKYALGMLEEAAEGDAKEEISNILSSYKVKDYTNSKNMSFGNALFVRDTFDVKKEYKSLLQESGLYTKFSF